MSIVDAGIADGRARRWSVRTSGGQTIVVDDVARSLRVATDAGSFLEMTTDLTTLHAATDLVLSAPGRAMVVRARSVDFLHADATEDAATVAAEAAVEPDPTAATPEPTIEDASPSAESAAAEVEQGEQPAEGRVDVSEDQEANRPA